MTQRATVLSVVTRRIKFTAGKVMLFHHDIVPFCANAWENKPRRGTAGHCRLTGSGRSSYFSFKGSGIISWRLSKSVAISPEPVWVEWQIPGPATGSCLFVRLFGIRWLAIRVAQKSWTLISFPMVLLKHHGNAGAVHEDDLPVACPFFEEGRFEPTSQHRRWERQRISCSLYLRSAAPRYQHSYFRQTTS